jgi:hypothetical protein
VARASRETASVIDLARWLERIDPGVHRRVKGLRLATVYGIAAMLGALHDVAYGLPDAASLSALAGNFALWASVSEGQATRGKSARDLALLCAAITVGALSFIALAPLVGRMGQPGFELILISGAFFAGYLRPCGVLGAGVGSQLYLGQLLAFGAQLTIRGATTALIAGTIAVVAAIVPRMLSGPAEQPPPALPSPATRGMLPPALSMGLQAAVATAIIVLLDFLIGLTEAVWAITACVYVIANSTAGTLDRVRRRIIGTAIGVPLALAFLPVAGHFPVIAWAVAAFAIVIYAMALPERYDIACGTFAFILIVTLGAGGEHSITLLAARAWETLLGGLLGLAAALLLFPIQAHRKETVP